MLKQPELVQTWEDDDGVVHLVSGTLKNWDEPLSNDNDHYDGFLMWVPCFARPRVMQQWELDAEVQLGSRKPTCLGCIGA